MDVAALKRFVNESEEQLEVSENTEGKFEVFPNKSTLDIASSTLALTWSLVICSVMDEVKRVASSSPMDSNTANSFRRAGVSRVPKQLSGSPRTTTWDSGKLFCEEGGVSLALSNWVSWSSVIVISSRLGGPGCVRKVFFIPKQLNAS